MTHFVSREIDLDAAGQNGIGNFPDGAPGWRANERWVRSRLQLQTHNLRPANGTGIDQDRDAARIARLVARHHLLHCRLNDCQVGVGPVPHAAANQDRGHRILSESWGISGETGVGIPAQVQD